MSIEPIHHTEVDPLVVEALKAHASGDYALFSNIVSESFRQQVSAEAFVNASRDLGGPLRAIERRRYLGSFMRSGQPVFLYVLTSKAHDDEILVQVSVAASDDGPLIDWMWIE